MAARPVLEVRIGDRLELRKPHPCGSRSWAVARIGADIGIVCDGCGRRVLLERRDLERQVTRFIERTRDAEEEGNEGAAP